MPSLMNRMSNGATRLGKSYMRTTSRQMIGVGKGLISIGDNITPIATSAAGFATLAGQPELAVPLAGVAFMGGLMSAGGRASLAGGRVMRNVGLQGESIMDQKKQYEQLYEASKKSKVLMEDAAGHPSKNQLPTGKLKY